MNRQTTFATLTLGMLVTLCMGGCPRPEDALEPNNTPDTATRLTPGQAVEARAVQGNPDLFAVTAAPGQTITFELESLGEEVCNSFKVIGPDGGTLYEDDNQFCGRVGQFPIIQAGGRLDVEQNTIFRLTIPSTMPGDYVLFVHERGQADNIFDYSWKFRLTARVE